jgi:hypothetical protein
MKKRETLRFFLGETANIRDEAFEAHGKQRFDKAKAVCYNIL